MPLCLVKREKKKVTKIANRVWPEAQILRNIHQWALFTRLNSHVYHRSASHRMQNTLPSPSFYTSFTSDLPAAPYSSTTEVYVSTNLPVSNPFLYLNRPYSVIILVLRHFTHFTLWFLGDQTMQFRGMMP